MKAKLKRKRNEIDSSRIQSPNKVKLPLYILLSVMLYMCNVYIYLYIELINRYKEWC